MGIGHDRALDQQRQRPVSAVACTSLLKVFIEVSLRMADLRSHQVTSGHKKLHLPIPKL